MESNHPESRDFSRKLLLCRLVLYGAPIAAALVTVSIWQALWHFGSPTLPPWSPWWSLERPVAVASALLAGLASATAALALPNRLSVRIAHALSAGLVSIVVYFIVLAILMLVSGR